VGRDRRAQDLEIARGVLLVAEDGRRDRPRRVVDRPDEGDLGAPALEPVVAAAVNLEEEPCGGHPGTAAAEVRRAPVAWARQPRPAQDLAEALAAEDDPLAFGQELAEVAVVERAVRVPPQPDDPGPETLAEAPGRTSAPVAVDQTGRPVTFEGGPQSPELPLGQADLGRSRGHRQLTLENPRENPRAALLGRGHRDRRLHLRRLTESRCSWD